jgi:hypothetical protein
MPAVAHKRDDEDSTLPAGTGVQVRTRFDGRWASGFEIADVRQRGAAPAVYRLRRRSDHRVLPAFFPSSELRPDSST